MIGINPVVLRTVLGGGGLFLSVLTLRSGGQTGTAARESDNASSPLEVVLPLQASPLANSTLQKYSNRINPGLFGEGAPARAKPASVPVKKVSPISPPVTAPLPANPLADFVYTGFVQANGQQVALIENKKSREGFYLQIGDAFGDGIVNKIEAGSVEIKPTTAGQASRFLPMNTRYSLTPLDKGNIGGDDARQVEVIDNATQNLSLTFNGQIYKTWMNNSYSKVFGGISEEEAQHLQNEVFEGRMTAEEAAQHGLGNGASTVNYYGLKVLTDWSYDSANGIKLQK
jgi:hypothetical protein